MSFPIDPGRLPLPAHAEAVTQGRERWLDAAARQPDAALARFATDFAADPAGAALLAAIFGNSPFLGQCLLADIAFARRVFSENPSHLLAVTLAGLADEVAGTDEARLMKALRVARRRVALLTAVADIAGLWPLEKVTAALSGFADRVTSLVLDHLLRQGAAGGAFGLGDATRPAEGSGVFILGMGKLGAGELNYSSDIDLIVLFDDEAMRAVDRDRLQTAMVRLARNLIRLLQEPTRDGYVFRTDLRLRPDPSAMPLAVSALAAETYYESAGQNWERAAMIKARTVAGDQAAGAAFLRSLVPFVWRKSLDFAAIADVHSIKRQIHAHRGHGAIAVEGHNIKLGRGGIREIEFFAQTQQLIWGGRDPRLRQPSTCAALTALADVGRVRPAVARELIDSYRFLRRVEHRLQMVDDRQTHTLPADPAGLAAIATFLGCPDAATFARDLRTHLERVGGHYAELFEDAPQLGSGGNLVFTGTDNDPGTLATLGQLGYRDPASAANTVRGWHHGRFRATRSGRARELLTELMPVLLEALGRTADPDGALARFNTFLSNLPAGVQLFALLHANPKLLELVAAVMGSAPRLAEHLARHPALFEALLLPSGETEDAGALAESLDRVLAVARDFEDVLDQTRRWTNDQQFRIGMDLIRGFADATRTSERFSDVAVAAVAALLPRVEDAFAERHGRIAGGMMAVLALGKLGSGEMTAASDLDLILVYDAPSAEAESDGPRPLAALTYYTRLASRMVSALTAPTAQGQLYAVDMRLRPSGAKGPLATSLTAFRSYHAPGGGAWTWEHLALTRARVVAGPPPLAAALAGAMQDVLRRERARAPLLAEVAAMRERMAREHRGASPWDVKYRPGGLVDIEFTAQTLQLLHGHAHPQVLHHNTAEALSRLCQAGLLAPEDAGVLLRSLRLWQAVQGVLRLTVEGAFAADSAPEGLCRLLARVTGEIDFATLQTQMSDAAAAARAAFERLIVQPAVAGAAR